MRLYHGTVNVYVASIMSCIDFTKSHERADFGRGFYLTKDLKQAERWADRRSQRRADFTPAVLEFELSVEDLKKVNYKEFLYPDVTWKQFVFNNRIGCRKLDHNLDCKYDVVLGPLCDGNMVDLDDVRNGNMSADDFMRKNVVSMGSQLSIHTDSAKEILVYKAIRR